ncbi:MAG: hypothetical protein IT184_17635 [Acidobacteria bacterium]|nr:hypothetical protein [Acidobacteriota bacterium]
MTAADRRRPWAAFAALYTAIVLVYAWPLLPEISAALPKDPGDPALNAWILWWNSQAVPLTDGWWNAPIFFPIRGALALSETLLGLTPLTTPLLWLGASPVTTYNIAFLISYPASALAMHALAYRLTGRHDAALLAGLAYGFHPYRVSQIPHLQMLWAFWMPLCLWALHGYLDTRRWRALAMAGGAWLLNGLTCGYYLAYFAVLVACWMLWFARTRRDWQAVGGALACASLWLAPLLWGYRRYQRALGVSRPVEEIQSFSADVSAFWAAHEKVWLPAHWTWTPRPEAELYLGVVIVLLTVIGALVSWHRHRTAGRRWPALVPAIAGLVLAAAAASAWNGGWRTSIAGVAISLTRPVRTFGIAICLLVFAALVDPRLRAAWRRRSPLVFYAAATLVMGVFALGPSAHAFGTLWLHDAPYSWLMALPGGNALRVPARFGMLCALCLSTAAAVGFSRVARTRAARPIAAAIGLAILADGWMPDFTIAPLSPATVTAPGEDRGLPLLELPMENVFSDTAAMLRSTMHRHPLINGFSGYAPAHYGVLQHALTVGDDAALEAFQRGGPLLVAVDRSRDPAGRFVRFVEEVPGVREVARTPLGPLFRLPAVAEPPAETGVFELPISYVDASNYLRLEAMLDRDLRTIWQTGGPQRAGDQVIVVLDRPMTVARFELDLGGSRLEYPRELEVDLAEPGHPPVRLWDGRTAGLAILGALNDQARMTMAIPVSARGRRFTFTLRQGADYAWSIAELRAFGTPQ